MQRFALILAAAAILLATAPRADATLRPRPTDVPAVASADGAAPNELQVFDDYAAPGRVFSSSRAVVHYVVLGADAPPLNDDDADGVPDYVQRVGGAADRAIDYFERRGFHRIRADAGGPDARPDLYISLFAPGYLGVALPATRASGGAFAAVSNRLDPSVGPSFCSLDGTVAHELFHLVQFSYYRPADDPAIPAWALEGSAAAMENRVNPELDDAVSGLQLRRWFDDSDRSLTEQTYGSQLLWRYLDERAPRLLPALLSRLAAQRGPAAGDALVETFQGVAGRPFGPEFARFARRVAEQHGDRVKLRATLAPGARTTAAVAPLAIHFLGLRRSARSIAVRVARGRAEVSLVYRLASEYAGDPAATRRLPARAAGGALRFDVPAALRRNPRFGPATLLVSNGGTRPATYSLQVR